MIRVVPPERRLAERGEQVSERFEAEKVQPFVAQLELDALFNRLAGLALLLTEARRLRLLARLFSEVDVALFDQALDQAINQLGHRLGVDAALIVAQRLKLFVR